MLVIAPVYNIWGFISTMTLCTPLEAYWDGSVQEDYKTHVLLWAALGLHVAADFLIFFIPMPVVWRISIFSCKEKAAVVLIFALRFFCALPPPRKLSGSDFLPLYSVYIISIPMTYLDRAKLHEPVKRLNSRLPVIGTLSRSMSLFFSRVWLSCGLC